jgi:quinol monooxygenase YgiN
MRSTVVMRLSRLLREPSILARDNPHHGAAHMRRYVVTADFRLQPGAMQAFMPLMIENAERSRTDEPGCDRFDVLVPAGETDRVFLYEIYRDEAAFQAHLQTPHFKAFNTASQAYIKERAVAKLWIENDDGK